MSINITERAACELKELMAGQNKLTAAFRVWVEGGGCSGLSYGMAFDEGEPDGDDSVFNQEGIKMFVDGLSLQYLQGATVDYVDDMMGGGFKIDNPNAVASCGCGSSFQAENGEKPEGGCGSCGCG